MQSIPCRNLKTSRKMFEKELNLVDMMNDEG
jgi:hypothetical protein